MQVIAEEEIDVIYQKAKKGCSDSRHDQIVAGLAMMDLLDAIKRSGYIIVKRDSVVSKRRTDKELIAMLKDKGLER